MKGVPNQKHPDLAGLTALERAAGYGHESVAALSIKFKVSPAEVKAALDSYLRKTKAPPPKPKEKKPKRKPVQRGAYQRWTPGEVETLKLLVASGLGWAEIAKKMNRSPSSVRDKALKVCGTSSIRRITTR